MMYGINWDKSDEIELLEKLEIEKTKSLQNAKLASLGEMSAGIAHEINNPLAIISGNLALLEKNQYQIESFKNKIETIKKSVDRISKIVNGLKKFSRYEKNKNIKENSITQIVKDALLMTELKAKQHSTIVNFEFNTEATINCDEIEIEQVIINLVNNAIDAVSELSEKWVTVSIIEHDQNIVIQIRDSGKGIPNQIAHKLFQPFFTTKKVGMGTGLGLSISRGILDEHQATIELLKNDPHTCFEIVFKKLAARNAA